MDSREVQIVYFAHIAWYEGRDAVNICIKEKKENKQP